MPAAAVPPATSPSAAAHDTRSGNARAAHRRAADSGTAKSRAAEAGAAHARTAATPAGVACIRDAGKSCRREDCGAENSRDVDQLKEEVTYPAIKFNICRHSPFSHCVAIRLMEHSRIVGSQCPLWVKSRHVRRTSDASAQG